jgi:hypothetical protein
MLPPEASEPPIDELPAVLSPPPLLPPNPVEGKSPFVAEEQPASTAKESASWRASNDVTCISEYFLVVWRIRVH